MRSNIGIIAQDPVLLSGTLRLNLDIEGQYTDDQLHQALATIHLIGPSTAYSASSCSVTTLVEIDTGLAKPVRNEAEEDGSSMFQNLDMDIIQGGDK